MTDHPTPTVDIVSTVEAVARTGATYRQLDHWTSRGYVVPVAATTRHADPHLVEGDPASPGSGRVRWWTPAELDVVALMVALTGWGLAPGVAAKAARALVDDGYAEAAPGVELVRVAGAPCR